MALDFPTSPAVNQTYTFGSYTWRWDGVSWVGAVPIVNATINNTTIGATTPSTGAFTTLSANSLLISPFSVSAASTSVLRISGTQAVSTLQGYDGVNAYGLTLYNATAPNVILQSNGTSSFAGGLNLIGVSTALRTASNSTNATLKDTRWVGAHYLNAEEDMMILFPFSDATTNTIAYGGGAVANNAATNHDFYTAANNTTTSGTLTASITSTGLAVTGTLSASSSVSGTQFLGNAGSYILATSGWGVLYNSATETVLRVESGGTTALHVANTNIATASSTGLAVAGALSVIATAIVNSSTQTVVASGTSGLCWIRDASVGGTALVLWDASHGVTLVTQLGSIFTIAAPSATQIQVSLYGSLPYGVQLISGATRNGDTVSTTSITNQ